MAFGSDSIPYTLTIWSGSKRVRTTAMPNGPSKLTWTEDFPTTIEYTLGPNPKREHNVPKRWTLEIAGRTGVEPRKGNKTDDIIEPLQILDEFIEFLEDYQKRAAHMGAVALSRRQNIRGVYASVRLEFNAYKENIHLFVEPGVFTFDRDAATTRQSASWSLTMHGWQRVAGSAAGQGVEGWAPPFSAVQAAPSKELQVADSWAKTDPEAFAKATVVTAADWKATNDAILDMQRQSAETRLRAKAAMAATMPPGSGGALGVLASALSTGGQWVKEARQQAAIVHRAVQDFRSQLKAGLDVLSMPSRIFTEMVTSLAILRGTLEDLVAAGAYVSAGMGFPAVYSYLLLVCAAEEDATVMLGSTGGKVPAAGAAGWSTQAGGLTAGDPGYGAVFVLPDNTYSWADVAVAVYGDSSFWQALAKFNFAADAYSDKEGKPLAPGTPVFIPAASGQAMDGKAPNVDDFYLTDALIGADGDMVVNAGAFLVSNGAGGLELDDGQGSDLQLVTGYANLVQAVVTRSRTPRGALSDMDDYGMLQVQPGDAGRPNTAAQALAHAQSQLLQDFRINAIEKPAALLERDVLSLVLTIVPAGAAPEPLEVVVPLPAA